MWPGRNTDSTKNRQKVFSSAHINMKWLLMSRNRGVHEISVSWPSSDQGETEELAGRRIGGLLLL